MTITKTLIIKATPTSYGIYVDVAGGKSKRMSTRRRIASFNRIEMAGTAAMAMAACVSSLERWMNIDATEYHGDMEGFDFLASLDLVNEDDPQDDFNSKSSRHHY